MKTLLKITFISLTLLTSSAFAKGQGYSYEIVSKKLVSDQVCALNVRYSEPTLNRGRIERRAVLTTQASLCQSKRVKELLTYLKTNNLAVYIDSSEVRSSSTSDALEIDQLDLAIAMAEAKESNLK